MIVHSPAITVSGGAGAAVFALGSEAWVLDVSGQGQAELAVVDVPGQAQIVRVSPDATTLALGLGDEIALYRDLSPVATASVPGRSVLIDVGADGEVVAITRSDDAGTRLVAFDGIDLAPVIEPVPLGRWSAHQLCADSPRAVLVAGHAGPRAWEISSEPYARHVQWRAGVAAVDWQGAGLPNDLRFLRSANGMAVASHDATVLMSSMNGLLDAGEVDSGTIQLPRRVDDLVISPGGSRLCLASAGRLWSAAVGSSSLVDRGEQPPGAAIAIDDDDRILAAWLSESLDGVVATAESGKSLTERHRKQLPRSVFDER